MTRAAFGFDQGSKPQHPLTAGAAVAAVAPFAVDVSVLSAVGLAVAAVDNQSVPAVGALQQLGVP